MAYSIKMFVLGPVSTNCYICYNDESKEAFIVDPAANANVIIDFIEGEKLTLKAILLTHGHFDHIGAAAELREKYHADIYAHEKEEAVVSNPAINLSASMGRDIITLSIDKKLKDSQTIDLIGLNVRAFHTPGHTVGGVCYYVEQNNILFSGDTLFAESVGRTDFPGGSMREICNSIKEKLFALPEDTKVLPGHGEETMIKYEKYYNPFVG